MSNPSAAAGSGRRLAPSVGANRIGTFLPGESMPFVHRVPGLAASALLSAAVLGGCGVFQSPYSDHPTFTNGEKSIVTFAPIANANTWDCKDSNEKPIPDCKFTGKVILTKPTDNVSFQFFRDDKNIVICASPAEVAKSISTSGALAAALGVKVAGAPAAQSASASSSATEALQALASIDAPTHFVAVAMYNTCLQFASGMLSAQQAADQVKLIITVSPTIGQPAKVQ